MTKNILSLLCAVLFATLGTGPQAFAISLSKKISQKAVPNRPNAASLTQLEVDPNAPYFADRSDCNSDDGRPVTPATPSETGTTCTSSHCR